MKTLATALLWKMAATRLICALIISLVGYAAQASDFNTLNEHVNAAIARDVGSSDHGSIGIAIKSLRTAPLNATTKPIVDAIFEFGERRDLDIEDMYTRELIAHVADMGVVLMDPGVRGGLMFQEIVDRLPPPPSGVRSLRDLFADSELDPTEVIYLSDSRCGQERIAGVTLGQVATVCGAWGGVDYDSNARQRLVATHEAAHVVIYERYRQLRGYPGLVDAAQSIFGDLDVDSNSHINEFFGLASEVLTDDDEVWEMTLVDMCQTELHLASELPDYVPSQESPHSLGYAVMYNALRELEQMHGVPAAKGIQGIVNEAYDGPDAQNHFPVRTRIRKYVKRYVDADWKAHIRSAYLEPALAVVAWLDENSPDPALWEGDRLYRSGRGSEAIEAWASVEGAAQGAAYDSVADTYFWGTRGVEADGEKAFEWRLKAIRAGDEWAGLASQHARDDQILIVLSAIEDAIRVHGDSDRRLLARAQMYERLGNYEQSENDLQEIRRRSPGEPSPLNSLGYFMADRDIRVQEAIVMLEKANVLTYGRSPYILDSVGWAYYRAGRLDDALDLLETAFSRLPYDQAIAAHLGEVLWRLDRRDDARDIWAQVDRTPPTETLEYRLLRTTIARLEAAGG